MLLLSSFLLSACGGAGGEPELNNAVEETNTGGGSGGAPGTGVSYIIGTGPVLADGSDFSVISIGLYDNQQRPLTGVIPTFSATDTNSTNIYNTCSPTNSNGVATCTMSSTRAEDKELRLVSPESFTGNTITFYHGPADHITLLAPLDSSISAGTDFTTQPSFEIRDAFENVITDSSHTLTLSPFIDASCSTPAVGTLNANTNPISASGVFNFSGVNHTGAEMLYIAVDASAGSPNPPSLCLGPIDVTNNLNFHLEFAVQPSGTATAGQAFASQPEVHILDQFGNPALAGGVDTDQIEITAFTNATCTTPAVGTLQGTNIINASAAVVDSFNLNYTKAPETIFLRARNLDTGTITDICSNAITMSPDSPDATQSTIIGTGPVAANGFHFSDISINLRDQFLNPIQGTTPTFLATDTGADNAYTACSLSDATGLSQCELRSNTTELKTLSLITPVVKPVGGTVNFINPPDPANTTIVGTQTVANLVDTSTITVTMLDAGSSPVVGITPTFIATDTGTTNVYSACSVSNGSGVSTCGLQSSAAELKTLTITMPMNNFAGGTADFIAGAATAANSNITGTTNIIADGVAVSNITITLRDAFNNPVSGQTPTFSATDTGTTNAYSACSVSNASGISTCTLTSTVAENKILQIETPVVKPDDNVDFIPGAVGTLVFTQQPSSTAAAGINFPQQPIIQIQDAFGNIRETDTSSINLAAYTDASCTTPAGGTLGATNNPQAANGTSGEASFIGVNYDTTGFVYLRGELSGVTVCSNVISVTPAPPSQVAFAQQPSNTTSTQNISPSITVEIQDVFGNVVPTATDNVTLAFGVDASGGSATLSGTLTVAAIAGVATFSDINIDKIGTGYTLSASSGVLSADTSNTFDILVGAPAQLAFNVEPIDALAGANIAPAFSVDIQDAGGNFVSTATDNVTIAFNNDASGGSATLGGTLTIAAVGGTATFSDINIDKIGTAYTVDATSGALTAATSAAFNILPAAPAKLSFNTQPSNTVAASNISPTITVDILDAFDNFVSTATNSITLAINNDPSVGATLGGTLTVAAVAGVATFSDINIDLVGVGYTLDATSGGLTLDTSDPFNIEVGTPDHLAFVQEPTNTIANLNIAPAITVEIRDGAGNLVPTATDNVTLVFNNDASGGSAALGGTLTVAAVAGVATFSDINIDTLATGYTLDATATGLTLDTSASFDIITGPATQVVFVQEPTNTAAAANIAPAITVEFRDAGNNLVSTETSNVTLAFANDASGGSATLGGTLTASAVAGVATFSDINIDSAATGYTLDASSGALTNDTSASFDITVGAATQVVFTQEPTNAVAGVNIAPAMTVEFRDAGNNLVSTETSNVTLAFANDASSGSATLGGTLTVAAVAGVATFSDINIDKAFTGYTFDASSGALTNDTSASFDITPAAKDRLSFSVEPTNTTSGSNITPAITVEIHDAFGNITSDTDNITLAINNNPSAGTLSGTLTASAVAGTATFSDINIDSAGVGYTLDATATGLTLDTSASFDITVGAATQVVFVQEPTNAVSAVNTAPAITVEFRDSGNNLVSTETSNVTLAFANDASGGSATLGGTLTVAAVGGVATFSDINIDSAATGYTLDASSGALTNDTSASFDITAGAAAKLSFSVEPTNAQSGVNINPAIEVQILDANDNLTSSTDNITLAINNNPGGSTLSGTLTVAAVAGTATFSDINLDIVGTGYTLDATSGALTLDTSASFDITPAGATQVVFVQEPTNAVSGANIAPAITVEFRDSGNNLVSTETSNVTLAFANDASGGSATLGGTLTVAAVGGVATFSDINIDSAATGYTFDASSGALTNDTSASFDITAGAAAKLSFSVEPTNAQSGVNINPAIEVQILDANDNLTSSTDNITLAINNNPGGSTLSGTLTVAAVAGTATFSDINLDIVGTGYTLDATSGALTLDTSASFDITAGAAAKLSFSVEPTNAQSGINISPAIEVQILDANDNLTSSTDNITLAINNNPGGSTLSGTLTVAAVSGTATFSDINLDQVATGYTLDATSGALTLDTSTSFDVTAAGATQVVFVQEPTNAVAGVNIAPAITVEFRDAGNNLVATETSNVTLSFANDASGGSATLGGTLTVAAVGGVATFSNISVDKAFTGYTFDASSGALTSDTSASFDITPAAKDHLLFSVEPAGGELLSALTPAIRVQIVDAYDNLTADTDTITLSINNNPGGATLGGTVAQAAVAGEAIFNDITFDQTGSGYTLDATAAGLTAATSAAFNITGPPTQLGFSVQPSNIESGATINPAIRVEIQDASGNVVTTETNTITLAFQNDPSSGGATLSGTLSVAAVSGVATFNDISVDSVFADYTLNATTGGLTTAISNPFDVIPAQTGTLTLITPASSPDADSTPTIRVASVFNGDIVKLYTTSNCTPLSSVGSMTSTGTTVDITTSSLAEGAHTIYATRTVGSSTSACSTISLAYEVSGSFDQLDNLDAGLGNWSNVGGDDRDWTHNTGTTPSVGIGPEAGLGSSGGYAYTEASNPTAANDVFILESNTLDGAANPLAFSFYWSKRGDNMGDLILEASNNGGTSWTQVWSHLGADIATGQADVWRNQFVDLCTLGYTANNVQLRFRAVMPGTGNVWNSDIGVDDLHITSGGCVPNPPATVTFDTPLVGTTVDLSNQSAFAVGGTCSDNGQNVTLSGDVSGSTSCSGGSWSLVLNLSAHADGPLNMTATHTSSSGGADGTKTRVITKDATLIQHDTFDTDLGNWSNVAGDDRDWTKHSGNTPSGGVGPSSAQGSSAGYVYTEASNPVAASDVFILESNSLAAGTHNLNMEFYWNKRGDFMGDLFLEVSTNGGASWDPAVWSHSGTDVARNGTDVWNQETVDLCNAGYNSGNILVRFRAVMPAAGTVWHSDIALDEIKFTTTGCP